ncbi:hypothetical protein F4677DRAFT_441981 [Hypoxylon crocopeplum]|nr:hypothetical protein F4677DRAFT_441981 [Hypoxylon crocopeplum]
MANYHSISQSQDQPDGESDLTSHSDLQARRVEMEVRAFGWLSGCFVLLTLYCIWNSHEEPDSTVLFVLMFIAAGLSLGYFVLWLGALARWYRVRRQRLGDVEDPLLELEQFNMAGGPYPECIRPKTHWIHGQNEARENGTWHEESFY